MQGHAINYKNIKRHNLPCGKARLKGGQQKSTSASHTASKDINFNIKVVTNFIKNLPALQVVAPKLQFSVPHLE